MKKIIFLILVLLTVINFSNDYEFGSEGEHLIPLEESEVSIKKEKIVMKLTEDGMRVDVRFVFDSPVKETKKIGFITPPAEQTDELFMSDFSTKVNGKNVISNQEDFYKSPFKTSNYLKQKFENMEGSAYHDVRAYVYYFDAPFLEGENVVEHSYLYSGSGGVDGKDYSYVITTISKWKNKRVEDFELIIDMGENKFFMVPYTFWENKKRINWEIIGEGKIKYENLVVYEEGPVGVVSMKNGYIRYKEKKFSPDLDINIYDINYYAGFFQRLPSVMGGEKIKDNLTYISTGHNLDEIYNLDDEDLRIIKNYPYAMEGYDFSDKKLKKYFSSFFWYNPVSKDIELTNDWQKDLREKVRNIESVRNEINSYLKEDLDKYSKEDLRKIRNLPYALREYKFKDKELTEYFKSKYEWYIENKYTKLDEVVLNNSEIKLINKIDKILNKK